MAIIIMLLPLSVDSRVRITYADKNDSAKASLYYDNGNGFTEKRRSAKQIEKRTITFRVKSKYKGMSALRFDPVDQKQEGQITIEKIDILSKDRLIDSYRADELQNVLEPQNDIEVLLCNEAGLTFLTAGEEPQFLFADEAVDKLNAAFYRNHAQRLLVILLVAFTMFVIFHKGFLDCQKWFLSALHALYFVWYAMEAKAAYGKQTGFLLQTCLWIATCLFILVIRNNRQQKRYKISVVAFPVAVTVLAECTYGMTFFREPLTWMSAEMILYAFAWMCAVLFLIYVLWNGKAVPQYLLLVVSVLVFRFFFLVYGMGETLQEAALQAIHYPSSHQFMLTMLAIAGMYMILRGLIGDGIAIVCYFVLWAIFFVGNLVIMIFHQSVLKPLDFLSVREAAYVAKNFLGAGVIALFGVAAGLLVFVLLRYRKRIRAFLKPELSSVSVVFGSMLLLWIFSGLNQGVYSDWYIMKGFTWGSEANRLELQGFVPYFYYHCQRLEGLFPKEPEGYSEEMVKNILEPYRREEKTTETDQKPDVIYIMLESIFDVDELNEYGVEFSKDPDPVMDQYQIAKVITPIYGGLTSRAEFEGLTGLSGSFYPAGTVEYSTFWGSGAEDKYALPAEFAQNGYRTVAIHQNSKGYYNRNTVYDSIGIDHYVAEEDYGEVLEEEDRNEDSFLTNRHFLKLLKKELEAEEKQPQFIWGITIESHNPYLNKYKEAEIDVVCDNLGENATRELENFIQSVKRTDEFVAEVIEYVDHREKPTLVVMYGDHRPPLEALDVLGVNADSRKQHTTLCLAYSNFSNIEVEQEYISINYIPALIAREAGLKDGPFYSYLDAMRQEFPVVSDVFLSPEFEARKKEYEILQYDILFGKGYCAE